MKELYPDLQASDSLLEKLLEQETYFQQMADNVPLVIWVTRPDGYCTYLNQPWYALTGQTMEEAIGFGWLNATHPDDLERAKSIFLDANAKQIPFTLTYRLREKTGNYRWTLDKGKPRFRQDGRFEGFVGALLDIDEQKKAEERLHRSVKAGKVGLFEWDTINNKAIYSDLLLDIFGLDKGRYGSEFNNAYQLYQSIIHPEDQQYVNDAVAKVLEDDKKEFYIEFRIIKPTDQVVWIAERAEVVFEGTTAVKMNGSCIDITARKEAEEKLQTRNKQLHLINKHLELVNHDLDSFVYIASHDLKSPILNIEGLLDSLKKKLGPAPFEDPLVDKLYSLLYHQVERFKTTIQDLTTIAKTRQPMPHELHTINLTGVAEEVIEELKTEVLESNALFRFNFEVPEVLVSKKDLKIVLNNLISNAIKYRSPHRQLSVELLSYYKPPCIVLAIKDNGLGIGAEQTKKIFDLFQRMHNHTEGSGIGLYIVKRIVEKVNGKIEVESKLSEGTTFKVYLPIHYNKAE